tara:strand:+ start:11 stop:277 length:267 start_codon:yes stop_codon:yes gene_type:complete
MIYIILLILFYYFYNSNKRVKLKSHIDNLYYIVQDRKNNLVSLYYFSRLLFAINKLIFNLDTKDKIYIKYYQKFNYLKDLLKKKNYYK